MTIGDDVIKISYFCSRPKDETGYVYIHAGIKYPYLSLHARGSECLHVGADDALLYGISIVITLKFFHIPYFILIEISLVPIKLKE